MQLGLKVAYSVMAVSLCLTASAIQGGIVLKRVVKAGDVVKYRLGADLPIGGSTANFTGLISEKITKAAADGGYTVESKNTEGKVTYQGTSVDTKDTLSTMTFNAAGQITLIVSDQDDPNTYRMANLQAFQYPSAAVKLGDSWQVEVKKDDKGSVDAKGTYKIEGEEKLGERDTYRIHAMIKESIDNEPASVDATYWIDAKDFSVVKVTGTWTNAPFPSPIGPATARITMIREG